VTSRFRDRYHFCEPGADLSERIFLQSFLLESSEVEETLAFNGSVMVDGISDILVAGPGNPLQALLDVISRHLAPSFTISEQENGTIMLGVSSYIRDRGGVSE
jgi:hypothetical protein